MLVCSPGTAPMLSALPTGISARAFLQADYAVNLPHSRGLQGALPLQRIRDLERYELLFGGNLNNGANAGVFYWNGNNAVSNSNWNYGSRNSVFICVLFRCFENSLKDSFSLGGTPKITSKPQPES